MLSFHDTFYFVVPRFQHMPIGIGVSHLLHICFSNCLYNMNLSNVQKSSLLCSKLCSVIKLRDNVCMQLCKYICICILQLEFLLCFGIILSFCQTCCFSHCIHPIFGKIISLTYQLKPHNHFKNVSVHVKMHIVHAYCLLVSWHYA